MRLTRDPEDADLASACETHPEASCSTPRVAARERECGFNNCKGSSHNSGKHSNQWTSQTSSSRQTEMRDLGSCCSRRSCPQTSKPCSGCARVTQKMNSLAYCDRLSLLFVSTSKGILAIKVRFVFRDFEEVQRALVCGEVARLDLPGGDQQNRLQVLRPEELPYRSRQPGSSLRLRHRPARPRLADHFPPALPSEVLPCDPSNRFPQLDLQPGRQGTWSFDLNPLTGDLALGANSHRITARCQALT